MDEEQQLRSGLRQTDYVRERTAWIKAQREVTELKLAAMRLELVPAAAVAMAIGAVTSAVKQSVLAVPASVSHGAVGKAAEEINGLIYEALRMALEPFDEVHIERLIREACEGVGDANGSGAKAPSQVQRKRMGRRRKAAKSGGERESRGVAD